MTTTKRKVIVENCGGYWLAMDETGQITEHPTADHAYKAIQRIDAKQVRNGTDIAITEIEWLNVPPGFVTPGGTGEQTAGRCRETP